MRNYHAIGRPIDIRGKFTTGIIKTLEDAVKALSRLCEIKPIDDASFVCTEIEEREEIKIFHLQQTYQGLIVINGTFRVIATHAGEPVAAIGLYVNGIDINITPALTVGEARKAFNLERRTRISTSKLAMYKDHDNVLYLCWLFTISSRNPLSEKEIVVDANTGRVLADIPLALSK